MQIRASIRQAELLADYLRNRTIDQMDNAELYFLTTFTGYRPYGWNRAAVEQPLNYAADGLEDVLTWDDGFTEADIERPRLREFAAEIQALIEEEYR